MLYWCKSAAYECGFSRRLKYRIGLKLKGETHQNETGICLSYVNNFVIQL